MDNEKILVEIAAYRDSELINTIKSAKIQADHPERVYFAVCYQSDDEEELAYLKTIENVRVKHLSTSESRGLCYARYLCQKMIKDEKYVYQIDSHMRFVKHWDTGLINQLTELNDPMGIISVYPGNWNNEKMKNIPLDDKIFDDPCVGGIMRSGKWKRIDSPFTNVQCVITPVTDDNKFTLNFMIAGGNFFSFSKVHKTVYNDPDNYFLADELPMSVRLFTYGYNIYNPNKCYAYHLYNRENRYFPQNGLGSADKELERVKNLLDTKDKDGKIELKKFGLGNVRTLKEFELFSGIDFHNKILYRNAELGIANKNYESQEVSFYQKKYSDYYNNIYSDETLNVLVIDYKGEYEKTINICLERAMYKNKLKFIIATTKQGFKDTNNMHFISIDKNDKYGLVIKKLVDNVANNKLVMMLDSDVRFEKDWDIYYKKQYFLCGKNAVLTGWTYANPKGEDSYMLYVNKYKYITSFQDNKLNMPNFSIEDCKGNNPNISYFLNGTFAYANSDVFKTVCIDPNLNYEEHQLLYSLRLWTFGYDIYVPVHSYASRICTDYYLKNGINNKAVVNSLLGKYDLYDTVNDSYSYKLGDVRPLWRWYELNNIKYEDIEKDPLINV